MASETPTGSGTSSGKHSRGQEENEVNKEKDQIMGAEEVGDAKDGTVNNVNMGDHNREESQEDDQGSKPEDNDQKIREDDQESKPGDKDKKMGGGHNNKQKLFFLVVWSWFTPTYLRPIYDTQHTMCVPLCLSIICKYM